MAVFTAVKNGDMDSAATFGGATTPGNGDEITLGGFTVSCSSDKRALANGITIIGTGKLLILSGGAFKTAVDIPATCAVQFGEPEGVGAGPLPAYGALDANASGEIVFSVHKCILGPCQVWTARRTGKGWARVANRPGTTESILDDASTDWRVGDVVVSLGPTPAIYEYAVTGWDAGTMTLGHASMLSAYNAEGVVLAQASCAAHVRRTGSSNSPLLDGGLIGEGDLYLYSAAGNGGIRGDYTLAGRLVMSHHHFESLGHADELIAAFAIGRYALSGLTASGGVAKAINFDANTPTKATLANFCLTRSITPPSGGYQFDVTLIDCTLPTPLLSGALSPGQLVKVANAAMTTETLHTAGGIATKVQHAELPGTNDLPDAYLLAPVTGRAYVDYLISVKRGQAVRLRYHAWLGAETAASGYDIYDANRQVPGLETPLQSFVLPEGDILEWHRPTPAIFHNSTERDMVLRIRAWAEGDNVYIRCSPEQGGGAL